MQVKIEKLISAIRNAHPDNENMYLYGRCYDFFLILRSVRKDAEPYYSRIEGHVYTKIDGEFYDIRGKRLVVPADIDYLDHSVGDKPHRWGGRDRRRLV